MERSLRTRASEFCSRASTSRDSDVYERNAFGSLAVEQVFTALLDAVPGFVAQLDVLGDFLFVSRELSRRDASGLPAAGLFDLFEASDHERLSKCLAEAATTGTRQILELDT